MLFLWLLGLFLIFPFVELALLLWMAAHVGWLPTLALVVVTAIVGAAEVRREGFRVWIRFNEQLARGELPTDAMFDGLLVLVAGVLLLTPGLITDVIGFALLFRQRGISSNRLFAGICSNASYLPQSAHVVLDPHGGFIQLIRLCRESLRVRMTSSMWSSAGSVEG
jgi:UPF0716 protein FxsA